MRLAFKVAYTTCTVVGALPALNCLSLSFHRAARAAFGGAKHVNLNAGKERKVKSRAF